MDDLKRNKRYGANAHAHVHRMRQAWMQDAVEHGMSYEEARIALRRAIALAFPCVVMLAMVIGYLLGWAFHGRG